MVAHALRMNCTGKARNAVKIELIYTERYATRESVKQSVFHYIEVYYNRVRRHSTIGSMAPMVFESQFEKVA